MTMDEHVSKVTRDNPNMLVPWYLITGLAYYEDDDPIVADHVFDQMAKDLLEAWDSVEHVHKRFITVDMLKAGSLFIDDDFPSIVRGSLDSLRRKGVPKPSKPTKKTKKQPKPAPSGDLMDLFE